MAISFYPSSGLSTLSPAADVPKIPEAAAILRARLTREPLREQHREAAERHLASKERLGALRARGFHWMPWLEQRAVEVLKKAEAAAKALPEGPAAVAEVAQRQLAAVEQQAVALAGVTVSPELGGALVAQFNSACALYHAAVEDADRAVSALVSATNSVSFELKAVEAMLDRFDRAAFSLKGDEQPVAAFPASWTDAPGGAHAGALFLTTACVRFERDEEIKEGGLFGLFAKSSKRVHEVELELPLSGLSDAAGELKGWVMKDHLLTLSWKAGSPGAPKTCFKLEGVDQMPDELDEPEEWATFLERLCAQDIARYRVDPSAWQGVPPLGPLPGEAPPVAPTPPAPAAPVWPAAAWMQVSFDLDGDSFEVALTGSSTGAQTAPQRVEGLKLEEVEAFAEAVRRTASRGVDLPAAALTQAHALFSRLFHGELSGALHTLRGAALAGQGKLLLRLMVSDPRIRGLPWEVLRGPSSGDGFLALHPDLTLVRGVYGGQSLGAGPSTERPRVLVVAPGELGPSGRALSEGLAAAHKHNVEVLPPLLGEEATWAGLSAQLMGASPPHALHLLAHGRIDGGVTELQLAGGWVPSELLAMAIRPAARAGLRLVYLESCETAKSGELASAAEQLTRQGAEAVVAQLWPVSPAGARAVARTFYDALFGEGHERGDVAASLNVARLAAAGDLRSAEFLCPVLYLRGDDPRVFTRS